MFVAIARVNPREDTYPRDGVLIHGMGDCVACGQRVGRGLDQLAGHIVRHGCDQYLPRGEIAVERIGCQTKLARQTAQGKRRLALTLQQVDRGSPDRIGARIAGIWHRWTSYTLTPARQDASSFRKLDTGHFEGP